MQQQETCRRWRSLPVTALLITALGIGVTPAFGQPSAAVTRGPYLQQGTSYGVVIRWRTDVPTNSRVLYGTQQGSLASSAEDLSIGTEHELALDGLAPGTKYYYAVGTTTEILAGNDADHFVLTSPRPGTVKPTRLWILGDSGTGDANAMAVRDAYNGFAGGRHTDLWLMLGDNAYPDGTDARYQDRLFAIYPGTLSQSVLWPALGNHDLFDGGAGTWPYFDNFTLPTGGEAGGVGSGTESYYSFDHANVHFVVLDSFASDRSVGSPMLTWLEQDLAATSREWIIAYWHHPPYSKGSHDSDNPTGADPELEQMRENVLPILDAFGVDMTLAGHSHSYERSHLIEGFHATPTVVPGDGAILDAAGGREDGPGGPYVKQTNGTVHTVAGSSGQISGGTLNHPVMFISWNLLGSVVLDISGKRLDATFLDSNGTVQDYYTILKGDCDDDGVCDPGEDCYRCPSDCAAGSGAICGNGTCEAGDGEDCVSCPADCRGKQNGKPANRFCCGDGDGQNPLSCSNPTCMASGFQCVDVLAPAACCGDAICTGSENGSVCAGDCAPSPVCGDGLCHPGEDVCACLGDCGPAPTTESVGWSCRDGLDNDCDGLADCDDADCLEGLLPRGAACSTDSECCSNKCKGGGPNRSCR